MKPTLPLVSPSEIGDLSDPTHLVLAQLVSVDRPHRINPHSHRRGQLIYASHGTLRVKTMGPAFMLPPQFAAWIPPGISHSVSAGTPIGYCSLFIEPSVSSALPSRSQLLHLTTILKELTRTAADRDQSRNTGAQARLHAVILDQLQLLKPARVALPMPRAPWLHKLVEHYLRNPGNPMDLAYWCGKLPMSARTLRRSFKRETGLTLRQWLQHLRVLKAIELLESGESVKATAYEVGYGQPSAFITMFKRVTGKTPTGYLSD